MSLRPSEPELTDSALRFSFNATDLSKEGVVDDADTDLLLTNRARGSTGVSPSARGASRLGECLGTRLPSLHSSESCWNLPKPNVEKYLS